MVSSLWGELLTRTTEESLELVCSIPQILLTRSRSETVSLSMRYTRLSNANERRLLNSQIPTDEQTDSEAVESSFISSQK
nr:MAG TPA: hypothetical protein [Caudoviricetes sp.]